MSPAGSAIIAGINGLAEPGTLGPTGRAPRMSTAPSLLASIDFFPFRRLHHSILAKRSINKPHSLNYTRLF